jgi:multidrug efflux pump subunit AcrA (membrane-fusion protein)
MLMQGKFAVGSWTIGWAIGLLALLPALPALAADARLDGTLVVSRQAGLRARVDGLLQIVWVHPGDRVRRGQALARVSSARLEEGVRTADGRDFQNGAIATSRRQAALAALEQSSVLRANCQEALARARAGHAAAAIATADHNLRAASQAEASRRNEVLSNNRSLDQAALKSNGRRARERARELEELVAPFDAVVMTVAPSVGSSVSPNGPVLLTVASLDSMLMTATAPPDSFRFVPDQGAATVQVDELPGLIFQAAVNTVEATYSPPDSRLTVTLAVANPKGLMQPGMHAHATLPLPPLPQRPGD